MTKTDQEGMALRVTPELRTSLNGPDATWPNDPAVPALPPLPDTDDPPPQ